MKHYIIIIFAALASIMAAGCADRGRTALDNISDAEEAIGYGRLADAQSIADALDREIDGGQMSVTAIGRLSLLHMKLNEAYIQETNDNVEKAVMCYRAAFAADPDSAGMFYSDCAVDDLPYCMTLVSIVRNMDEPVSWPVEEPDSIPARYEAE